MSSTATIRVPRETRDRLAAQAHERGVSLSALLTEFALRTQRDHALRSERDATRRDREDPAVSDEDLDWDSILGDGLR